MTTKNNYKNPDSWEGNKVQEKLQKKMRSLTPELDWAEGIIHYQIQRVQTKNNLSASDFSFYLIQSPKNMVI